MRQLRLDSQLENDARCSAQNAQRMRRMQIAAQRKERAAPTHERQMDLAVHAIEASCARLCCHARATARRVQHPSGVRA